MESLKFKNGKIHSIYLFLKNIERKENLNKILANLIKILKFMFKKLK